MNDKEVAYSTNDEEFPHRELSDVFEAMIDNGSFEVGRVYYEVDIEQVCLPAYLDAESILENAEERLYDEIGEAAEDAFWASKAAVTTLNTLLTDWAKEHLSGTYWKCSGKTRERMVTQEDIDDYQG